MQIQPYLFFNGRCDEAIEFYRKAVGAEVVMLARFKESPEPRPPVDPEKIMHAELRIGETTVFLSDGHCTGTLDFQGFSLCITVSVIPEAERLFASLCDDGKVQMPLAETFYSPKFGMVTDRFGVLWMVYVTK